MLPLVFHSLSLSLSFRISPRLSPRLSFSLKRDGVPISTEFYIYRGTIGGLGSAAAPNANPARAHQVQPRQAPASATSHSASGSYSHPSAEACTFCGTIMLPGQERRYKQIQGIADLLEKYCNPTPFIYNHIVARAAKERADHAAANYELWKKDTQEGKRDSVAWELSHWGSKDGGGATQKIQQFAVTKGCVCGCGDKEPPPCCSSRVRGLSQQAEAGPPIGSDPAAGLPRRGVVQRGLPQRRRDLVSRVGAGSSLFVWQLTFQRKLRGPDSASGIPYFQPMQLPDSVSGSGRAGQGMGHHDASVQPRSKRICVDGVNSKGIPAGQVVLTSVKGDDSEFVRRPKSGQHAHLDASNVWAKAWKGQSAPCPKSDSVPLCIACINWVRRLGPPSLPTSEQNRVPSASLTPVPSPPGCCSPFSSIATLYACPSPTSPLHVSDPAAATSVATTQGPGGSQRGRPARPVARRASTSLKASASSSSSRRKYTPLDNLFMFAFDPGRFPEPDKRCMHRLLRNLCVEYVDTDRGGREVLLRNPYLCFSFPIIEKMLALYKRRWFPNYRVLARRFKPLNAAPRASPSDPFHVRSSHPDADEERDLAMLEQQSEAQGGSDWNRSLVVFDVVRAWWVCSGYPMILSNKVTAKYVRKMLKIEW